MKILATKGTSRNQAIEIEVARVVWTLMNRQILNRRQQTLLLAPSAGAGFVSGTTLGYSFPSTTANHQSTSMLIEEQPRKVNFESVPYSVFRN